MSFGDRFEQSAEWIEHHPRTVYAAVILAFVGTCTAIRNSPKAARHRYEVLHEPRLDPYIVCPHCRRRFTLDQSPDFDESHIEQYIQGGRVNWFDGEDR